MFGNRPPSRVARAQIKGGPSYPQINGIATFMQTHHGTMVSVRVSGLPAFSREEGKTVGPHGFHIHTDGDCTPGTADNPFPQTGGHYNPDNQPHGNHAGDFPVLFSNHGIASMTFFTDRFNVADVVGKSVVIHEMPDDYRTQPAGNSGKKIACGVIMLG